MRAEIERKIFEYATKLEQLNGPDDKRVKKRVLQALGKLKKSLLSLDTDGGGGGDNSDEIEGTSAQPSTDNILSRKQLKAKLKLLNKELGEYAQKKQLKTAVKRFSWGVRKGMEPDKHTYANLMNCYVRCGDLNGALLQLEAMKNANIPSNIVIYTILLKGYCDIGDLSGAQKLLFLDIPSDKLVLGIRTVNTFIRGCTKMGAVRSALKAFSTMQHNQNNSSSNSSRSDYSSLGMNDSNSNNGGKNSSTKNKNNKRKRSTNDDSDNDSDNDTATTSHLSDHNNDSNNNDNNNNNDNSDESDGRASLYESMVALLCQALNIEEASLLAVQAVSLEEKKSKKFVFFCVFFGLFFANVFCFFIVSISLIFL